MNLAGVGLDAIEVARMQESLERTPSLMQRVFTVREQETCRNADGSWRYGRLAARFAAKEAVAKALGTGIDGFGFIDIEILNNDDGRPEVRLAPVVAAVAAKRGVGRLHLSLTHTHQLALAQVVAERAERDAGT